MKLFALLAVAAALPAALAAPSHYFDDDDLPSFLADPAPPARDAVDSPFFLDDDIFPPSARDAVAEDSFFLPEFEAPPARQPAAPDLDQLTGLPDDMLPDSRWFDQGFGGEFHNPKGLVRPEDVREGKIGTERDFVGLPPAQWVGAQVQNDGWEDALDEEVERAIVPPTGTQPAESASATASAVAEAPALPEFLKTTTPVIPGLTNCQANLMLKFASFYESGDFNLYYGRCGPRDKHHGIVAGYVDLTTRQGGLYQTILKYLEDKPENFTNPFQDYMGILKDTAAGYTVTDDIVYYEGFCDVWKKASADPSLRLAYDKTLLSMYIKPSLAAAQYRKTTLPLTLLVYFDSWLHVGEKTLDSQIWPNATHATDANAGEPSFVAKVLLMRAEYRRRAEKEAREAIRENGNFDYEWDTDPEGQGRWEDGLAAYASLLQLYGKSKEGLERSFKLADKEVTVAVNANGTKTAKVACEVWKGDGSKQRALNEGLTLKGIDDAVQPFGSWQKAAGALANGALIRQISRNEPFVEECDFAVVTLGAFSSEAITEVVGEYIKKISTIVTDFGGDVVRFLGDAILVSFLPQSNESAQQLCLRSLRCCDVIHAKCGTHEIKLKRWLRMIRQRENSHGDVQSENVTMRSGNYDTESQMRLTLHSALIAGSLEHLVLGELEHRLDYVLWGTCLQELSGLLEEAKSDESGISLQSSRHQSSAGSGVVVINGEDLVITIEEVLKSHSLNSPTTSNEISGPTFEISFESQDQDDMFRLFVNSSVLFRIRARKSITASSSSNFKSEFRVISVLMACFKGHPTLEQIQRVVADLLKLLVKCEGAYYQFSVDDKGKSLFCVFGLPPSGTEKTAIRALQTAISLHKLCTSCVGTPPSLSIATGSVLFGLMGCPARKEICLLGDVFNIAARIQSTQRKESVVALEEATAEVVKSEMILDDLGTFLFKGKKVPLRIWGFDASSVNRQRTRSRAANKLIGNFTQWDLVQKGVQEWLRNETKTFTALVEGQGGQGKTSLLNHVIEFLDFNCVPHWSRSASVFDYGRGTTAQRDFFLNKIRQALEECGERGDDAAVIMEILFFQRTMGATILNKGLQNQEAKMSLATALANKIIGHFLESRRAVLLVDDLQWLDAASHAMFATIMGECPKVDSLVKYVIELSPNSRSLNAADSVLATELKTIVMYQMDSVEDICILLEEEKVTSDRIVAEIGQSDRFDFLKWDRSSGEGECSEAFFRHIMIRDAIYESIALSERQSMHLKIASQYEAVFKAVPEQDFAIMHKMSFHYWRSSDTRKMVWSSMELGCTLARDYHNEQASKILSQVFDLLESIDHEDQYLTKYERARGLAMLAQAGIYEFEPKRVISYGLESLRLAGDSWPATPAAINKSIIRNVFKFIHRWNRTARASKNLPLRESSDWHFVKRDALRTLMIAARMYSDVLGEAGSTLLILWCVNHAIVTCRTHVAEWFNIFAFFTVFLTYFPGTEGYQVAFSKQLASIHHECAEQVPGSATLYTILETCFLLRASRGYKVCTDSMAIFERCRKPGMWFRSFSFRHVSSIPLGDLYSQRRDVTMDVIKNVGAKEPLWSLCAITGLILECFMTMEVDQMRIWMACIPLPIVAALTKKSRIMFMHLENMPPATEAILTVPLRTRKQELVDVLKAYLLEMSDGHLPFTAHSNYLFLMVAFIGLDMIVTHVDKDPTPPQQFEELASHLLQLRTSIKAYRKSRFLYMQLAHALAETCIAVVAQRTLPKSPVRKVAKVAGRSAEKWATRRLRMKETAKEFQAGGEMQTVGALLCVILSRVARQEDARRRFGERAKVMFEVIKARTLVEWLEGRLGYT
ncbi:hypothetical protein HDU96_007549 [Phlyctochytrium bullatum]|nr:hypothetical protein HDU96_007549 [Phlyctochytrium bullatum]